MRNLLLLILLLNLGCTKQTDRTILQSPSPIDESLGRFISSYTQNKVSIRNSEVRVRFSKAVIKNEEVGNLMDPSLYQVEPKVEGDAIWIDQHTLAFRPKALLSSNSNYQLRVHLEHLFQDVPKEMKMARIPFVTMENELIMYINSLEYPAERMNHNLSLSGHIKTSDFAPNEAIEEMLSYKQSGNKDLQIFWKHYDQSHHFVINGIQRRKEVSSLTIKWDGDNTDPGFEGERKIEIAKRGTFDAMTAKTPQSLNRAVEVSFSQGLEPNQDLNGLIEIKNYTGKYRFEIIGERVRIYPQSKVNSPANLVVRKGIKDLSGTTLNNEKSFSVSFGPVKPNVRLLGKGVIVPNTDKVIFPFEAINLKSAHVSIFKVFQDNVLQMLQFNRLSDNYQMQAVGRIVHEEKIDLSKVNPALNYEQYVRYALDLKSMVDLDPGSIYEVIIKMKKEDVYSYPCDKESNARYRRDNPCHNSYYNRSVSRNMMASNLGIVVKQESDQDVKVVISDLTTLEPVEGASVMAYDFQQQQIANSTSDAQGMTALVDLERPPSFIIARVNGQYGYVNIKDHFALSNSEFDVSGKKVRSGINGFVYADRGVWRPGDTIFLDFILEDRKGSLPDDHPVSIKVTDPQGKKKFARSTTLHLGRIYDFAIPTKSEDPTGNWTATIHVGKNVFRKNLKVETVKPNRLKIEIDAEEAIQIYADQNLPLRAEWLHGASGAGLKAKVDMKLSSVITKFKGYSDYIFDDPARKHNAQSITVYEGSLNDSGAANISIKSKDNWQAPGKLRAQFNTKVYEKSGNFSEDNFSQDVDLYGSYVGIDIPKTRWGSKFIKMGKTVGIPIVVLDAKGKPLNNRKLNVGLYEANWNWWYDRRYNNRYNYNSAQHNGAVTTASVTTDASGKANYNVNFDHYGNYMIRVCDDESGHCTGDLFYTGRYWSQRDEQDGPQQLIFTTDKKKYHLGEDIKVSIPSNKEAKILMSIEDGQEVRSSFWVDAKEGQTDIIIPSEAYPGISTLYISAHLIQKHNNGENDLAMRMYGVVPVKVVDPATELKPEIAISDKLRPAEKFTLQVAEENGVPMAYTVSIVDEGLLSLTRFKTPDPWTHFYAKMALGIKTWDIYDMVLNGYGGQVDQYISIGGDAGAVNTNNPKEANRFKPVVIHLGPYYLKAGETAKHILNMPNYVGAVRTMVVARNGQSYGNAEKTSKVKKPLMVQSTLPRVLGPNETLSIPVNVFAMEDNIKRVEVGVEASDNISFVGNTSQNLSFDKVGDQLASFDFTVSGGVGPASIKSIAKSGKENSYEKVDILIRNPNPITSKVVEGVIQPGKSWDGLLNLHGSTGTNSARIEVSQIPPIDFGRRLRYLIRYPYGCVEQTTSSAFPQLYLDVVSDISPKRKLTIDRNMRKAIDRLALFQKSNGGMSYWPGNRQVSDYGSVYAAHFLTEAKSRGYTVDNTFLDNLLTYLTTQSSNFGSANSKGWQQRVQAYTLYVLARNGRANIGAMNRLRTSKENLNTSRFLLAAAYAIIGKKDIAGELIARESIEVTPYEETGYSYGSDTRDMAMIAEALLAIGKSNEAAQIVKQLSKRMSSRSWYSTQETSYSLLAIGKYLETFEKADLKYTYNYAGKGSQEVSSSKPISSHDLDVSSQDKQINVQSQSSAPLFVRIISEGKLPPGELEAGYMRHLDLKVEYMDRAGNKIDPTTLTIGTDFKVVTIVQNKGSRVSHIQEVALTQIFPSGWEIQNERLSGGSKNPKIEYQDIRDDRVNVFFDLNGRKDKITVTTLLTATYAGRFFLPPVSVEAMYDSEIQAKTTGKWVEVKR